MERLEHILESQQFSREWLENELFPLAAEMEKITATIKRTRTLAEKEMVSFFYEPSTRTRYYSELAMWRLGGNVIFSTENAKEFSSVAKGETIENTIRILCLGKPDIIVLRTDEEGMAKRAAEVSTAPIINAGDGKGQHPVQAMTDLFTIKKELMKIERRHLVITGDLARGRTARSLAYLAAKYPGIKISFVSPDAAKMGQDVKDYLKEHAVPFEEIRDIREVAPHGDVFYITRIQEERGQLLIKYGPPAFWGVNQEVLDLMKKDAIIMHPLPHKEEIAPEVDKDPRAVYFPQALNKLYVMMALLKMILK